MSALNIQQRTFLDWNRLTKGDWNPFIAMQVTPCISESAVRAALDLLLQRYSFMRLRVVADDAAEYGYSFVRDDGDEVQIPLNVRDDGRDWHAVLEDEYLVVLDETIAPMARCLLVPNGTDSCTIILSIHHMLIDGVSVGPIISDFLSYLDEKPDHVEEAVPIDHHALLLKQYDILNAQSLVSPHDVRIQPPYAAYPAVAPRDTPLDEKRARSVFRVVEDITALRAKARNEGSSVTSVITAASLIAARDLCRSEGTPVEGAMEADGSMRGSALIVVDMRPFMDPPLSKTGSSAVGDCNSFLRFPYLVKHDVELWDLARTIKSDVTGALEVGSHWNTVARLYEQHKATLGQGFRASTAVPDASNIVSVSNVGSSPVKCDYGAGEGKFKLTDVFVSTAGRMFPPSMVVVAGTWVGARMSLCFSFMEPLMTRETTEKVADQVVALLTHQ